MGTKTHRPVPPSSPPDPQTEEPSKTSAPNWWKTTGRPVTAFGTVIFLCMWGFQELMSTMRERNASEERHQQQYIDVLKSSTDVIRANNVHMATSIEIQREIRNELRVKNGKSPKE